MLDQIIRKLEPRMKEALNAFQDDLKTIHTGRASTSLVEGLMVSYYGQPTLLRSLAGLSTPDASTILIQPWDQNSLGDIELALRGSHLNLNPQNDGRRLKITLPPPSQERRGELAHMIEEKAEEVRIGLRNLRQQAWEEVQRDQKAGQITEDDRYRGEAELNKLIDQYNRQVAEIAEAKNQEIMQA